MKPGAQSRCFVLSASVLLWAGMAAAEAVDGGSLQPREKAKPPAARVDGADEVIAEAEGVLKAPYARDSNLAVRTRLLGCVKRDERNSRCWALLATAYTKSSKFNEGDKAKAVEAWTRYLKLDKPDHSRRDREIEQRYPWVDYPDVRRD